MSEANGGIGGGTVERDIANVSTGSIARFYEIDLRRAGIDETLYFHPGLNEFGLPVVWGGRFVRKNLTPIWAPGQEYRPFPIAIEGIEYDGQGRLPRPTLTVSNVRGHLGALVRAAGDLNGCTLTHRMTLTRFLDAENFIHGNPHADPLLEFPKEIYIFERKAEETSEYIKFELASALDLEGQKLPKRNYNANYCPHEYRGPLCNYTGRNYYDEKDKATTEAKDKCGKRLKSCELRFGVGKELHFGGFPGCGLIARY